MNTYFFSVVDVVTGECYSGSVDSETPENAREQLNQWVYADGNLEVFEFKQLLAVEAHNHFVVIQAEGLLEFLIGQQIGVIARHQFLHGIFQLHLGSIVTHHTREGQD